MARPFGIPVHVSPYWFIIAGVFIVIYANDLSNSLQGTTTRYLVAAAFVVLLYLSVLVHELSHSLVARGYGLPVRRILLYPLGGISEIDREAPTPGREFAIAAAGPALSLVLGGIGWGLSQVATAGVTGALIRQLMFANIIVGLFNLLPGLPLDGGRMLRAVIWGSPRSPLPPPSPPPGSGGSSRWAARDPVLLRRPGRRRHGVHALGHRDRRVHVDRRDPVDQGDQVPRAAARAAGPPAGAPGDLGAGAARRWPRRSGGPMQAGARAIVVADHDNKPIAIVNETAVMATLPQRRPWIDVGSLARTIDPSLVLNADIGGMALLDALRRAPATEYLLTEESGEVYGVLAARDLDQVFAGV